MEPIVALFLFQESYVFFSLALLEHCPIASEHQRLTLLLINLLKSSDTSSSLKLLQIESIHLKKPKAGFWCVNLTVLVSVRFEDVSQLGFHIGTQMVHLWAGLKNLWPES